MICRTKLVYGGVGICLFQLKKVQAILEKENYHVILTEKRIRDNTHPSNNYYQYTEMELGSKWEYSLVINERVNQPKKKRSERIS